MLRWFKNMTAAAEDREKSAAEKSALMERNKSLVKAMAESSDAAAELLVKVKDLRRHIANTEGERDAIRKQLATEKNAHANALKNLRKQTEADILVTGLKALGLIPREPGEDRKTDMHNLVSRLASIDKKLASLTFPEMHGGNLASGAMQAMGQAQRGLDGSLGAALFGGAAANPYNQFGPR